jgi:hypothetical protein
MFSPELNSQITRISQAYEEASPPPSRFKKLFCGDSASERSAVQHDMNALLIRVTKRIQSDLYKFGEDRSVINLTSKLTVDLNGIIAKYRDNLFDENGNKRFSKITLTDEIRYAYEAYFKERTAIKEKQAHELKDQKEWDSGAWLFDIDPSLRTREVAKLQWSVDRKEGLLRERDKLKVELQRRKEEIDSYGKIIGEFDTEGVITVNWDGYPEKIVPRISIEAMDRAFDKLIREKEKKESEFNVLMRTCPSDKTVQADRDLLKQKMGELDRLKQREQGLNQLLKNCLPNVSDLALINQFYKNFLDSSGRYNGLQLGIDSITADFAKWEPGNKKLEGDIELKLQKLVQVCKKLESLKVTSLQSSLPTREVQEAIQRFIDNPVMEDTDALIKSLKLY